MGSTSFADHLAGLDDDALVALLRRRPDACVEPVPSDLSRLADRLCSPASLGPVVPRLDRDTLEVGRAIAVLGKKATVPAVADLLDAPKELVERPVDELGRLGLAWRDGARLRLPERLSSHWQADIGGAASITSLAGAVLVEELRRVAEAQGIETKGLRKHELVEALHAAWSDRPALSRRIAGLRETTRQRLLARSLGRLHDMPAGSAMDDKRLVEAGLLLRQGHRTSVPREVALACWLASVHLSGVPELAVVKADGRSRASTEAAAQEALRLVTTLLDDAARTPVPALKSGGIGKRERARLAKRLALPDDATVCLIVDVAFTAGLLGVSRDGYTPTETYRTWREDDAAARWTTLATAWFGLAVAPSHRLDHDGKEVAPPHSLPSSAGILRRALIAAASPDRSVSATAVSVDWFCPLHQCDPERLARLVDAARSEAAWFGAVVDDAVSELGRALAGAEEGLDVRAVAAELLADPPCEVVLQSDLTAVVAGRPDAAATRLLSDAADPETRGTATTYRFSPATVRRALDAGWDADGLRAALRRVSDRPLPQPLDYLVGDVARRHGEVRVRPTRACVVGEESLVEELLRSRALRGLDWSRLAPTVLSSPQEPEQVLAKLRSDGYFPVREDDSGALVVDGASASRGAGHGRVVRESVTPEALISRLRGAPGAADSATVHLLAGLNPRLDGAELELLADAVDRTRPVHLTYRDQNGTVSYRTVTPERVMHRWLVAWCHLRKGEREFTVASIQGVAPPAA